MIRIVTFFICLLLVANGVQAQNIITQWNFNSTTPDNNTGTGVTTPSIGAGTLSAISIGTASFNSGAGSSDPTTADNSGLGLTGFPAQGSGNKTAGIQFSASTVGRQNIVVSFDLRQSNTGTRHFTIQYTTDITATTPTWVDFVADSTTAGDAFVNNRTYNFSAVAALNNNATAGFRVVASFRPGTSTYVAATTTSNYATTGTWRFDMVTVKDTVATQTPASVAFVGNKTTVTETTTTVNITANLTNGNSSPSSVNIELLPLSTATNGTDFTLPTSLTLSWPANANNVTQSLAITINNDALPENAEYFIVRFTNPVNVTLPAAATNHYTVMITDDDKQAPVASGALTLNYLSSFSNGAAGTNSAEIVAHDPATQRLFIANSVGAKIDIINFSNPAAATLINSISVTPYGNINSIAVRNGIVAAAIENAQPQQPGSVVFFNTNGTFISQVTVGVLPDMITFSPDGTKVLTANEGEPNLAYTNDPEGSISIINISGGVAGITQSAVSNATFTSYNAQAASLRAAGVRIFGYNNPTVAQDLEPEYIAFSADGATAYVTCQENNAIAVVNIATATVTEIRTLGTKNHSSPANALDVSDQGTAVELASWPIKGLYQPDAIASYSVAGQTYLVTANEGDSREYTPYVEAVRAGTASYVLDSTVFPYRDALKANIGRLNVSTASGDTDGDGDFDEIYAFGGRSISIWNATTGALVWDGGQDMELITSKHPQLGAIFNASNANNTFKNRSDDKGPEPEGVTVATIGGHVFAFATLERIGGCLVYEVTDPANPVFVDYKNSRTIASYGGDQGPEGIVYISAANSPTGVPIVILANEVSSTLAFYSVAVSPSLDISLKNIKAYNVGNYNKVDWTTASEERGDLFEVEKSKDGIAFSYEATVAAKGTAATYTYTDEHPYEGTTYYRLKLKHLSGKITYSSVVTAYVKGAAVAVQIFPNPAGNYMTRGRSEEPTANATADLLDMRGAVLKSIRLTARQTAVDVHSLPAGVYTLRYRNGNTITSVKMTKQ